MLTDECFDVVVVGGGAAGLSAALTFGRAGRSTVVLDNGMPRNRFAAHMQGFLSRDGLPPADMLAIGREDVERYGVQIYAVTAESAQWDDTRRIAAVRLTDGSTIEGRRLLVTTGLTDELPDIPGIAERWGKDVIHCPYCHGYEVRQQAIGVLVTGEGSLHQAFLFRQWTEDLTVFTHTRSIEPAMRERLASRDVTVIDGMVRRLVLDPDNRHLTGFELHSGRIVARQAIVVAPTLSANASILAAMDTEIERTDYGSRVVTDRMGRTSIPGIYAAGNVADPMTQVMAAAASGTMTAAAINGDLMNEDFDRAEAARAAILS
ncbi:MAG: NAD(P)/FAD-dependent oxidoreductase [Thermomicrobiales bacterium]